MNGTDLLPASVLKRKAVVYVRQSTPAQVQFNLESQRQQYELVEVARRRGFDAIEIIDDDLGKSASGMVARPGFERLVASLCAGHVGLRWGKLLRRARSSSIGGSATIGCRSWTSSTIKRKHHFSCQSARPRDEAALSWPEREQVGRTIKMTLDARLRDEMLA